MLVSSPHSSICSLALFLVWFVFLPFFFIVEKMSRDYFLVRYDKNAYTAQKIAVTFSKKKREKSKGIDAIVTVNDGIEKSLLSISTFVPLFLLGRKSESGFDIV